MTDALLEDLPLVHAGSVEVDGELYVVTHDARPDPTHDVDAVAVWRRNPVMPVPWSKEPARTWTKIGTVVRSPLSMQPAYSADRYTRTAHIVGPNGETVAPAEVLARGALTLRVYDLIASARVVRGPRGKA